MLYVPLMVNSVFFWALSKKPHNNKPSYSQRKKQIFALLKAEVFAAAGRTLRGNKCDAEPVCCVQPLKGERRRARVKSNDHKLLPPQG